jgi:hypothetical protein
MDLIPTTFKVKTDGGQIDAHHRRHHHIERRVSGALTQAGAALQND